MMAALLPKLYDISSSLDDAIFRGLVSMGVEMLCGLFWACVSWAAFRITTSLLNRFRLTGTKKDSIALGLTAFGEFLLLACPLSRLNGELDAHPFHHDGNDPFMSQFSSSIGSAGILLAFPLACAVAGYITNLADARHR